MIFIFIGPDMAGKTTLATSICRRSILPYRKFSHYPTPEESVAAAEKVVDDLLMDIPSARVFDRFHFPDDLIYGPATNRYDIPQEIFIRYIDNVSKKLETLQASFIYCHADLEVLNARYAERGDDYIVPEYLPAIIAGYRKWLDSEYFDRFDILELDSGILTPEKMVRITEEFIFKQLEVYRKQIRGYNRK